MSDHATVISIKGGVVAGEVAEHEFARFLESMDLDPDLDRMSADERRAHEDNKRAVLRAIESGRLSIDENGQPVFIPTKGVTDTITFFEPTGATFMAMDSKRRDQDIAKTFSLLAQMTKQPEQRFATMAQRDLKVCRALLSLFLA